jgi:hypothetical protein
VDIHDIPGRMIGYLHPKSEVILVRTAGAAAIVISFCLRLHNVNLTSWESLRSGGDEEGRRAASGAWRAVARGASIGRQ